MCTSASWRHRQGQDGKYTGEWGDLIIIFQMVKSLLRDKKGGIMPGKRLKTLDDLRRYMASLITRTESGEVEPTMGGKLTYMVSVLARVIEGGDLERRVGALEKKQSVGSK